MRFLSVGIFAVVAALGCGGKTSDPPLSASGVPKQKRLADLTADEIRMHCDWMYGPSGQLGPYEKAFACEGGRLIGNGSRADCIDGFASVPDSCEATVGDSQACVDVLAGDPCRVYLDPPECDQPATCRNSSAAR